MKPIIRTSGSCLPRVPIGLLLSLAIHFLLNPVWAQSPDKQDAKIEQALWWLPLDTETLFVARGPFLAGPPPAQDQLASLLEHQLQLKTYNHLVRGKSGPPPALVGARILFAMEGSRRFRAPKSIGSMPYEGCQIIRLGDNALAVGDALQALLAVQAEKTLDVQGRKVFYFTWQLQTETQKLPTDVWTYYIARPLPDTFLAATHEGFLREVLERMERKSSIRALPSSLIEWKHIDRNARFWALRHFVRDGVGEDPTSPHGGFKPFAFPDSLALGTVFSYSASEGREMRVRYLTNNEPAKFASERLLSTFKVQGTRAIRTSEVGILEIPATIRDVDSATNFFFFLFTLMGHGIYP